MLTQKCYLTSAGLLLSKRNITVVTYCIYPIL